MKEIEEAIPRIIYQIKKYDHPEWGIMYRCYLSRTFPSRDAAKNAYDEF
jgi:hypothetical protein